MSGMVNKKIKLYCKGGWEVDGVIVNETDNRFVVVSLESTFVVFKDSVSIIEIPNKNKKPKNNIKKDFSMPDENLNFPENSLNYSEYQSSLPKSMLKNYNEKNNKNNDLSISFGGSLDSTGRIEFGVKDESENKKNN